MADAEQHSVVLSVIVPLYDEEGNVEALLKELDEALREYDSPFEAIIVDDHSKDATLERLKAQKATYPWLRVIHHTINAGQSAAILTGYQHARGEITVSMDGDLQYDCHDILRLVSKLHESGADGVTGIRAKREDSGFRTLASKLANGYRKWVTGDDITDAGCAFRAIKRECLRELPPFNGLHRFLPTILRYQGHTIVELDVAHRPRVAGVSKYGINNRLWRGLADCRAMKWYRKRAFPAGRIAPEE